ncbi:hypothetical protein DPMN_161659 [Dreissena polymorpha]|uniref:Uncharacterized protein n=1 Tax=Dreissena polymorpha TaxID=45954 RepID=A0A9D4ESJ3_DREPO|nr:hypothetical protein DPMN_161659 [Dreissena polymorpha]
MSKEANVPEDCDFIAVSIILPPISNVFWKKALQTRFLAKRYTLEIALRFDECVLTRFDECVLTRLGASSVMFERKKSF